MTPVEFRGDLWHQNTRLPWLSCGAVCVILRLAVLVEHRLVTERQTDRQTDGRTNGHRAMASTADAQHHAVKRKATVGRIYRTEKEGFKPGMKE